MEAMAETETEQQVPAEAIPDSVAAAAEVDISPEALRDLLARSVVFVGLAAVSLGLIGMATWKMSAILKLVAGMLPG